MVSHSKSRCNNSVTLGDKLDFMDRKVSPSLKKTFLSIKSFVALVVQWSLHILAVSQPNICVKWRPTVVLILSFLIWHGVNISIYCVNLLILSRSVISMLMYPIPFDLGSQAHSSRFSNTVGDHVWSLGTERNSFFIFWVEFKLFLFRTVHLFIWVLIQMFQIALCSCLCFEWDSIFEWQI